MTTKIIKIKRWRGWVIRQYADGRWMAWKPKHCIFTGSKQVGKVISAILEADGVYYDGREVKALRA